MKAAPLSLVLASALVMAALPGARADTFMVDLTHPLPTFKPLADDPMKPDLDQPWLDSTPVPTFGQQVVLSFFEFPTNQGHFDLGTIVLSEHHGTHLDAPAHYVNNEQTLAAGNPPANERKYAHMLGAEDLIGRAVVVDISGRVQAELDKNGGRPSPDTAVTDFSDNSGNAITADDIAAIEGQIDNGVWIVLSQGWSRFFFEGADWTSGPYVNSWNFPGLTPAAVDKIIEIEDAKSVRINGIVSDVIGVESGENSKGSDDKWTDSWYAHVAGLQRGWKFVENANNTGLLAEVEGPCTVVVGAPKHVRGSGGPSRVLAMCEN